MCVLLLTAACSSSDKPGGGASVDGPTEPVVLIEAPTEGEVIPDDGVISVRAQLTDDRTAVTDLSVSIESSISGMVAHTGTTAEDGTFTAEVTLTNGKQTLTVSATDGDEQTGSDSVEIGLNGPPHSLEVGIDPEEPPVGSALTAFISSDAVDPEGDEITYDWGWTVQADEEGIAVTYTTLDDPKVVPGGITERGQVWTVTVVATDSNGNSGEAATAVALVGNSRPSIATATLSPDPAYTDDNLIVMTTGWEDSDGDDESYRYAWQVNGTLVDGVDGPTLPADQHAKGDIITATVTPYDGFTFGGPLDATTEVQNTLPTALSASLSPTSPSTTDDITSMIIGWSDIDGDPESYVYRWLIDGVEVAGETEPVLSAEATSHFQEVVLEVTPNDGEDNGIPLLSSALTIGNTSPSIINVLLGPPGFTTADIIEATPGGWSDIDADAEGYSYAWTINGDAVGADASTLSPSLTTRGDIIACAVTPFDGVDYGTPVSSADVAVLNKVPRVTGVEISPAAPVYGDTLACSWTAFIDADSDPDVSTVEWYVDGASVGTGTTLSTGFRGGQDVMCSVTPYDGIEAGSPVDATVTISNTAPSFTGASITPDPARTEDTLTCSGLGYTDVDLDTDMSVPEWTINGVAAGSGITLTGGFSIDDVVSCILTPTDGEDSGTPVDTSITISNTQPTISSVSITPGTADHSTTLSCGWDGYYDADGHPDASTVEWVLSGGSIIGTGTSLSGAFTGGDTLTCRVTPFDGFDAGTPVTSPPITIDNSPPVIINVSLLPLSPVVTDTLTCTPTTTDADGTVSFSYTYNWYVGGVLYPGATTSTLSAPSFSKGQDINCRVVASDGYDDSTETISNTVEVRNSVAQVDSLSIGPSAVRTNDVITATAALSDADGDAHTASYEWMVNGVHETAISEDSAYINGVDYFNKYDAVSVSVTPVEYSDSGPIYGLTVSSDTITILNTAPGTPTAAISPGFPEPSDALTCLVSIDAADADGDTPTYTYSWTKDYSPTGFTGSVLPSSATVHDDIWECSVLAYDGDEYGGTGSATVVINDLTNPDPPVFDGLPQHTNDTTSELTGDCEADCLVEVTVDSAGGTSSYDTYCNVFGRFDVTVPTPRGEIHDITATCMDIAGNTSGPSFYWIESCDPYDVYEGSSTAGDSKSSAIDEWAPISDGAGSPGVTIRGNVLDEDEDDWYVISATQTVVTSGVNTFNFQVDLTDGLSEYRFVVHEDTAGSDSLCSSLDGYTEFDFYAYDSNDGSGHLSPSDSRYCENGSRYNECDDLSGDFYIQVFRNSGAPTTCGGYQLNIDNGY